MATKLSAAQRAALPQLVREFRNAIAPRISFRIDDTLPEDIYHYTTARGLEGIVREQKLRATNFSFMNDPSEIQHGRELVEETIAEHLRAATGLEEIFFQFVVANFNLEMLAEIYVCCFTKLRDDLSQWRAYGVSANERYSIGFDTEQIRLAATKKTNVTFTRVEYDVKSQTERISELLSKATEFIRHRNNSHRFLSELGEAAASRLAGLVPALKTPAYKPEREWRIVIWAHSETDRPQFDTARGVLRPYLELRLPVPLPITSLHVLAPTRKDLALKAAKMLLSDAGVAVKPEHSEIPFAE